MGKRKRSLVIVDDLEDEVQSAVVSPEPAPADMHRINPTAMPAYTQQGPGIGTNEDAVNKLAELTGVKLDPVHSILDVGFGMGGVIVDGVKAGCKLVAGVDAAQASVDHVSELTAACDVPVSLARLDVSHDALPWPDDTFDIAFCTETIEHLSNPYFMVSEVKRVLKHEGLFVLSFPQPARNLGYAGGEHAHVYPGFLQKESFERFMKQLYFHVPCHKENGASDWYAWRNAKLGGTLVDVFAMISGNHTEDQLYGWLR